MGVEIWSRRDEDRDFETGLWGLADGDVVVWRCFG